MLLVKLRHRIWSKPHLVVDFAALLLATHIL
jgi:hypothetical protein